MKTLYYHGPPAVKLVKRYIRDYRCWCLLPPLLFAFFIATAPRAFPQTQAFYVTIEPPGAESQQSQLAVNGQAYGATGVFVETFSELTTGLQQKGFPFDGNSSVGSYSPGLIVKADQYGGAGGTGNYFTVNTALGSPSSTTLTFVNPQRYFGLWWSAGDPSNVLKFYSVNTLVQTFTTSDVTNFINALHNGGGYRGNPNQQFLGLNNSENYAGLG